MSEWRKETQETKRKDARNMVGWRINQKLQILRDRLTEGKRCNIGVLGW